MKIKALTKDGIEKEYDVILTFHNDDYNKDYIVYTDNQYVNNELKIYINLYNDDKFKEIEDKKEFSFIKSKVNEILLTIKNESEKL